MLKSEAAAYLAGVTQTEGAEASAPTNLHVITGEVGEASADGKTLVKIDGLMFSESDDQFIEVDALGGLEEGDIATIVLTGEQGHAMTPLALGSIGSVDRITVRIAAIEADYIKVEQLDAAEARIGELEADHVSVDDLNAATARIGTLETTRATITDLEAATARIGDLEADHVSTDDLDAATARIGTLETNTADIGTIRANSAKVQNLTAAELEADHATVGSLSTTYATIANLNAANGRITNLESTKANISDLEADYITADEIEATYMHANMSNSDVAWIQNGTIKDGAIVSAMINDVSANKLTAGTINGSVINVTNLNADNITTGTINGQRIGEGSLSLSKLEDDVYTESEVDAKLATMQAEIDGAIETWTGTSVPTLNNSPASNWTTAAVRDTHVGDVYFVVNSQSQQNGYNYRFTKSGSTYSWQLIKDSDVTNALQRLETAEGKITTFDSDISTLKTDTGSLTTRTTNLETRMSDAEDDILDKVDTTTFNEVSDTVDQHSQTISQHTTAISNKADSSTVTAVTNRVSKNEQDISGINTTIGELQDTVETKADGSTVSTISNKLNTVSDTVDGHTQTLTSVQNTLSTKADSSTVSTLQQDYATFKQTTQNFESTVGTTYATKTELGKAVDNRVVIDEEFLYRTTGGEQDVPSGRATVQSIKGNTLVWNQLAQLPFGYNRTLQGITFTRSGDGMTFSGTSTAIVYNQIYTQGNNSLYTKVGHVYYVCKRGTGIEDVQICNDNGGIRLKDASSAIGTANAEKRWYFRLDSGLTVDGYAVVNIIDLTQMFGAGNEPATVAEFETMFPEPYYPYDAGSLLPVRMEGVESVGFNQLNLASPKFGGNYNRAVGASMTGNPSNVSGENPCTLVVTSAWGGVTYVAEVLSGQRYHAQTTFAAGTSGNARVTEYLLDSEFKVTRRLGNYGQNYTINHDITVQDGERYYAISYSLSAAGTMTVTDTIINLSDPARNGEYEPYWHSERPIPASKYFPNGMRSADSVYDELTETAAITRIGEVDLGTLNWSELSSPGSHIWRVDTSQFPATPKQVISNTLPVNAITIDYAVKAYAPLSGEDDKYFGIGNNRLSIIDHAYSTAEEFAASLSGKMMYYELATPVTTHIDPPLNLTYKVDSNGTERVLVDETQDAPQSAPLPMSVTYGVNLYESAGDDAASMASIESRVTTAESSITQNARNIELKVSETDVTGNYLVGKINLGSTTVKIDADRVEIDGTAVFSAISSDVDDAITSKGYQTSSQVNSAITSKGYATTTQAQGYATTAKSEAISAAASDATTKANAAEANAKAYTDALEIGGRNLLLAEPSSYEQTSYDAYTIPSSTSAAELGAETTLTIQFWDVELDSNSSGIGGYWGGGSSGRLFIVKPDADGYCSKTFTIPATTASHAQGANKFLALYNLYSGHSGMSLSIGRWKLEKGNKPTDWSPAPEDTPQYRVVTTSYSYALAQWLTYAAEGYTGSWITGTSGQGVRAGDTVMLKGTNSDNGSAVYVLMTVNTLTASGAIANATSHGLIDPTAGQRADSAQSTANAAAPKANAVKRTQRIWYRKSASGAPSTPGTASSNWVTKADDGNDAWTKMHIAISSTHKYIYTCEQYEMANGTVGYTSVLLDNTITVIDGGNIITGSVYATALNAADINASKTLTVGAMTDAAASTILNSNVQVGGRNLLQETELPSSENVYLVRSTITDGVIRTAPTTSDAYADWKVNYLDYAEYNDGEYTVSVDARLSASGNGYTSINSRIYLGYKLASRWGGTFSSNYDRFTSKSISGITNEWNRVSVTFKVPDDLKSGQASALVAGSFLSVEFYCGKEAAAVDWRRPKLEKGNKATDWIPAPEDQTAYVDDSVSSIQVGGRNLLLRTATLSDTTYWWRSGITSLTENKTDERGGSDAVLVTPSTTSWYLASTNDNTRIDDIGGQYVASVWMRADTETTVQLCCRYLKNDTDLYSNNATRKLVTVTTEWQQFAVAGKMINNQTSENNCVWVGQLTSVPVYVSHFQLERGNKATDWTPAPEDTTASVDQTYVQNLTPYFSMSMTQQSDDYWGNLTYERFTQLEDGWAHFEYTNTGSSVANNYIYNKAINSIAAGSQCTLLIEFRNVSISADGGSFYSQQNSTTQIWGTEGFGGFSLTNAEIRGLANGKGLFRKTLTLLDAESKDKNGTVRGTLPKTTFMGINQQVQAGQTVSYDIRLSVYEGVYTGSYKPYSGDILFATNSALTGTNESLEGAIADIGELSDQLVDTTTEQNKTITDIQKYLNSLRQDLDAEIQSRQQWLNFNSAEGLIIGATGSTFKTVTTNTSQQFRSGGTVLAETSGTEFVAPVMRSDQILIGNWMWTRRDNGNLSLKWIG